MHIRIEWHHGQKLTSWKHWKNSPARVPYSLNPSHNPASHYAIFSTFMPFLMTDSDDIIAALSKLGEPLPSGTDSLSHLCLKRGRSSHAWCCPRKTLSWMGSYGVTSIKSRKLYFSIEKKSEYTGRETEYYCCRAVRKHPRGMKVKDYRGVEAFHFWIVSNYSIFLKERRDDMMVM